MKNSTSFYYGQYDCAFLDLAKKVAPQDATLLEHEKKPWTCDFLLPQVFIFILFDLVMRFFAAVTSIETLQCRGPHLILQHKTS